MGACGALRCHGCKQPLPGAGLIIRVGSRGRDPRLPAPAGALIAHPPSPDTALTESVARSVHAELVAVLVAVTNGEPRVLTTEDARALPAGPFELSHRSLQAGLRAWVEAQTHHPLGYVEQLYTFADGDRSDESGARVMSVSYLGLTREAGETGVAQVGWQDWYRYFPWEDRRAGVPALLDETIAPRLAAWCEAGADQASRARAAASARTSRSASGAAWNGTWCCSATSCCSRRAWCPRPRGAGLSGRGLARRAHAP